MDNLTKPRPLNIGVLGGMGPLATTRFLNLVMEITRDKYSPQGDYDYPPMVVDNRPVEHFNNWGFDTNELAMEKIGRELVSRALNLEKLGVSYIVMPCNTAFYFQPIMQKELNIPMLDIITITLQEAALVGFKKVGLLSSQTCHQLNLYSSRASKMNLDIVCLSDWDQEVLGQIILSSMQGAMGSDEMNQLKGFVSKLAANGAEAIILGCTELSQAATSLQSGSIPIIDSSYVLACELVERSLGPTNAKRV